MDDRPAKPPWKGYGTRRAGVKPSMGRTPVNVLVTGSGGLLGSALVRRGLRGVARAEVNVTDVAAMARCLREVRPEAVIFCAALTDVDACATRDDAEAVNVEAPARWAREVPTWFVSTNYVFSGPGPHLPDGARAPLMEYGRQKARAEDAVLAAGGRVVRTGWLYGPGGRNFPSRIAGYLRRGPVTALDDAPVQPTWADDLAALLCTLPGGPGAVVHAVGRAETTWFGFARAAAELLSLPAERVAPATAGGLGLGPRPDDARLAPATLPGWTERLPLHLDRTDPGPP